MSACLKNAPGPLGRLSRCRLRGAVVAPARPRPRRRGQPVAEVASAAPVRAPVLASRWRSRRARWVPRLTFVALSSPRADEANTRAAIDRAVAEIRRLEALDDDVARRQRDLADQRRRGERAGRWRPRRWRVIDKSLWISERSEGVFDITFEAMHGLWKFDEDADAHPPSRQP